MGDVRLFGVYDSSGNEIPDTEDLSWHSRYKKSEVVFEATENGTHYVSVGADHKKSGTCTLSVEEVM